MREQAPDVVLITPLVDLGSPQLDHYLQRARARAAHGAVRRQLGSPVEQVAAPRRAGPRDGLERDAEAGSDRAAPACRPARVVVTGAQCYDQWFGRRPSRLARGVLRPARPRSGEAVRPLRLLVALPEHGERGAVRRAVDPGGARQRRSGAARGRHPRPAASGAARRVAADRSDRVQERRVLRQPPGRCRPRRTTTSTRSPTRPRSSASTRAPSSKPASAGKPVLSVLLPEISKDNQEGTLHFHYLMNVGGGLAAGGAQPRRSTSRSSRPRSPIPRPASSARGVSPRRSSARRGSTTPSTPRFAERHRGGRAAAGAGACRRAADRARRTRAAPAVAGLRAAAQRHAAAAQGDATTSSAASAAISRSRCS